MVEPALPVPLARLLVSAAQTLIDALHARLAARGVHDVRPQYGYVMLAARAAPTTVTAIAALMGVTKQAASKLAAAMEAAGLLAREADAEDGRRVALALTARGHAVLAEVEAIYAELEAEWANVLGAARVEALRADLARVVAAAHGGELPAVRPVS
ncbi:MAG: MarR family transcriptional regulator [Myxococcales bacterium]|nr:MarR family transcriptional regulator [Myxococcales bacterium]